MWPRPIWIGYGIGYQVSNELVGDLGSVVYLSYGPHQVYPTEQDICIDLIIMRSWIGGWPQIALEQWSEGKWNPGGPSWQERFVPLLVVSWPVVYLLAMLSVQHRADKSKPIIT